MANVKFSRKEFEKYVRITEEIKEKIILFGTPLESLTDDEIELEIFPNRPDLLSLQGYLRSFLTFIGGKSREYKVKKSGYKLLVESSLPKEWPYAVSCIVKGLKFNDEKIKEIIDIQEKLGVTMMRNRKKGGIGIYPLEKISFPIRFLGKKPTEIKFRPLEYPTEINGRQILSKHPTGRTYAHICEKWSKFPVFIDNKETIMSMPPIINSHDVGKIDETTKDIFIEATGNDINTLQKAINIITVALADMGGEIYSMECVQQNKKKYDMPDLTPQKTKISVEDCEKLLGIKLKETEIKKLLSKMGHTYNKGEVESPAYRTDILHPVDIYEDIAIAYGYDKFEPELPDVFTIGSETNSEIRKRKIAEILTGLGLLEISSYHLTKKEDLKKIGIKQGIEVLESRTEYNILRPNLLFNSLKTLSENTDAKYPQKIFELGRIFEKKDNKIIEKEKLCITISGDTDFTEIKQILDYLMRMLDTEYKIEEAENYCFIQGRAGKIIVNNKEIGILGEISPSIIKNFDLKMPVVALEIEI